MIPDKDTNLVYFSKLLKTKPEFAPTCKQITDILDKNHVSYVFLEGTKDIWCRDYMPIQVSENKLVQFKYEPSYLNDKEENKSLKSDPIEVCRINKLNPIFSEINLDGGNVIKWHDRVILTDRIFDENEGHEASKMINELESLFETKVIIIPQIYNDTTGHADGLVRFFDSNTILVNELENEFKYWQKGIKKSFKENNLNLIEIPWFEDKTDKFIDFEESAIGLYINFLEIGNLIIVPKFEIEENRDKEAFELFRKIYPDKVIETININEIAKYGGLLNCITWTIKKSEYQNEQGNQF